MKRYGDDMIKWHLGFLVWIDRSKVPTGYPYGFFGLVGPLAIRYDDTPLEGE